MFLKLVVTLTHLAAAQDAPFAQSHVIPFQQTLNQAYGIAAGDLNGDGVPDLAIGVDLGIVVSTATAGSRLRSEKRIPLPCQVFDVAIADFNKDNHLDIAGYCPRQGLVLSMIGDGAGAFSDPRRLNLLASALSGSAPRGMTAADLNQDGFPDLAVGQLGGPVLLFGAGDGTFRPAGQLEAQSRNPVKVRPVSVIAADFNADGIPDIATANLVDDDDVSVFLGVGRGTFSPERKLFPNTRPYQVIQVDYNGDGKLDLAVGGSSDLILFEGGGDGSFRAASRTKTPEISLSVAAADLNADGMPDFVVGHYYGGKISVFLNKGGGALEATGLVYSAGDVFGVALPDLNGDGIPDLIASSYNAGSALIAYGAGDGTFRTADYLGWNRFQFAATPPGKNGPAALAMVADLSKWIRFLRGGNQETIELDEFPLDAKLADFNGDGIDDLVIVTVRSWRDHAEGDLGAAAHLLLGRDDGTYAPAIRSELRKSPVVPINYDHLIGEFRLFTGDFDGDGALDLLVADIPRRHLQLYKVTGAGEFVPSSALSAGGLLAAGDLTGDGIADVAVAFQESSLTPAFLSVHSGGAEAPFRITSRRVLCNQGEFLKGLETGDFNGDKKLDIVVNCSNEIRVLLNTPMGLYGAASIVSPARSRFDFILPGADFDNDGKADLIAIASTPPDSAPVLLLYLSDGGEKFLEPRSMRLPQGTVGLISGNFDDDEKPDLALMNALTGQAVILKNALPGRN